MSVYSKLKGIIDDVFGFDGGEGPLIKSDGTQLLVRNSSDAADAKMSGADPSAAQDFVTLAYHNANAPSGVVASIEVPFDFNDTGGNVDSTAAIPVGAKVTLCIVDLTVAFDAATTIDVGDTAAADKFADQTDIKETKIDQYDIPQYTTAIASVLRIGVGASAATAGAGTATVYYSVPQA